MTLVAQHDILRHHVTHVWRPKRNPSALPQSPSAEGWKSQEKDDSSRFFCAYPPPLHTFFFIWTSIGRLSSRSGVVLLYCVPFPGLYDVLVFRCVVFRRFFRCWGRDSLSRCVGRRIEVMWRKSTVVWGVEWVITACCSIGEFFFLWVMQWCIAMKQTYERS